MTVAGVPLSEAQAAGARALSHPLRAQLLAELLEYGKASPSMLTTGARRLGDVAYHMRVLADEGLISLVETRQRRGALEHVYRPEYRVTIKVTPL